MLLYPDSLFIYVTFLQALLSLVSDFGLVHRTYLSTTLSLKRNPTSDVHCVMPIMIVDNFGIPWDLLIARGLCIGIEL